MAMPMGQTWQRPPVLTAEDAVRLVEPRDRVYLHEVAMMPFELLEAFVARATELAGVTTVSLHTEGPAPHVAPGLSPHIRNNALFVGANVRAAVNDGRADDTPVFLSEVPGLFKKGRLPLDVALLQVSPPDQHGFCRLGASVACGRAAADHARKVIAVINPRVPRTMANSAVHVRQSVAVVEADRPLPTIATGEPTTIETRIGQQVAGVVPNGATIQISIGAIPDAVLSCLGNHEDLGIHTEMFSDGLLSPAETGVITNRAKTTWVGRAATSFALGSKRLYDFIDAKPFVEFHSSDIVNDTREIRRNRRMTAINSAVEVDLTGQVVADSIGHQIYSGIGGQMDVVWGASLAPEGRAIIALPSMAKGGTMSRIVPTLQPGAGMVTTRGHVQYVATKYGIVDLTARSLRERADLLISIAHPDTRADLRAAARERHLSLPPAPPAPSTRR